MERHRAARHGEILRLAGAEIAGKPFATGIDRNCGRFYKTAVSTLRKRRGQRPVYMTVICSLLMVFGAVNIALALVPKFKLEQWQMILMIAHGVFLIFTGGFMFVGQAWARTLYFVGLILYLIFSVVYLVVNGVSPLGLVFVICLVFAILLMQDPANRFFSSRSRSREFQEGSGSGGKQPRSSRSYDY